MKRANECAGNELEEVVGKAEKQSKMEEVMVVALAGRWVDSCVLWGFFVSVWFFVLLGFFEGRSYCCCELFSLSH